MKIPRDVRYLSHAMTVADHPGEPHPSFPVFDSSHMMANGTEDQDELMTLRRELEAANARIEALEAVQNSQRKMLRLLRHDFYNPLGNIRMAENILRRTMAHDTGDLRILDSLLASTDALDEIMQNFTVALSLQMDVDVRIEDVRLEAVLVERTLDQSVKAERKNITLMLGNTEGVVRADAHHLAQILRQLISNAIKFSPSGTTVRVETMRVGDQVKISVIDEGPGIPAEEQHVLFTEFGKLSNLPSADESAIGLGLWIVRNLTEKMGGTCGFSQPVEGGSVFWVSFPEAAGA